MNNERPALLDHPLWPKILPYTHHPYIGDRQDQWRLYVDVHKMSQSLQAKVRQMLVPCVWCQTLICPIRGKEILPTGRRNNGHLNCSMFAKSRMAKSEIAQDILRYHNLNQMLPIGDYNPNSTPIH